MSNCAVKPSFGGGKVLCQEPAGHLGPHRWESGMDLIEWWPHIEPERAPRTREYEEASSA